MSKRRDIGQKPFSFRGLAFAGAAGVFVIATVYAAFGSRSISTLLAMCAAGALLVVVALFLDRTWTRVRRFVILGSEDAEQRRDSTEAAPAVSVRGGYLTAAISATVFPFTAALIVGALTGEVVGPLIFGAGVAAVANLLVFVVWRILPRRRHST